MDESPTWEIEDLTEVQTGIAPGRTILWVGVAIAVVAAVVGFGFVGRLSEVPAPAPVELPLASASPTTEIGAVAPLTVTSPNEGASIQSGIVTVRGIARVALGTVHVAIRLGDAVLGWANVEISAPGSIRVPIRVFVPPFETPVELRIDGAATVDHPVVAIIVPFRLTVGDGFWVTSVVDDAVPTVHVEGFGSLADDQVDIRVVTTDGSTLATARVAIRCDDSRPGSAGARMIGLGSFVADMPLTGAASSGSVVVWVGPHHRVIEQATKPRVLAERR